MLTRHIGKSLQVTPGSFPDFWVGPGDEATLHIHTHSHTHTCTHTVTPAIILNSCVVWLRSQWPTDPHLLRVWHACYGMQPTRYNLLYIVPTSIYLPLSSTANSSLFQCDLCLLCVESGMVVTQVCLGFPQLSYYSILYAFLDFYTYSLYFSFNHSLSHTHTHTHTHS